MLGIEELKHRLKDLARRLETAKTQEEIREIRAELLALSQSLDEVGPVP